MINEYIDELQAFLKNKVYINGNFQRHEGWNALLIESGEIWEHYKNGKMHHDHGPARLHVSIRRSDVYVNELFFYKKGKIHRSGDPAVILFKSELHVLDLRKYLREGIDPIMWRNVVDELVYYQNGLVHREDGPALYREFSRPDYYCHGTKINRSDMQKYLIQYKLKTLK